MASLFVKVFGFVYYTVTTTTLMIFLSFFLRLSRRPNPQFYMTSKAISKPLVTFYSLINLFIFYYFFPNRIYGYAFYLLNEFITIAFSYFILSGFNVYGITGQICSGKTSACEYLKRRYRATIISLDDLNREVLREYATIKKIKKAFGNEAILSDSGIEVVNKSYLKKIIFNDRAKRKKLESITHPKVMMLFFKTLFVERFVKMKKFVFVENAILLRFNLFKMIIKGVISICVGDENVLIQRMMKRDNRDNSKVTEETAKNILKNQMSLNEFKIKSDVIIYNDENYQNLELKIDDLMREIIKFSAKDKFFIN